MNTSRSTDKDKQRPHNRVIILVFPTKSESHATRLASPVNILGKGVLIIGKYKSDWIGVLVLRRISSDLRQVYN